MDKNNNELTFAKETLIEKMTKNMEADLAFRTALREHNDSVRFAATGELNENVRAEGRKMFRNFSTEDDKTGRFVAYEDARVNKHSQKAWADEIARINDCDQTSIAESHVKAGMLKSVPVFNLEHSDFAKPSYVCSTSIRFTRVG